MALRTLRRLRLPGTTAGRLVEGVGLRTCALAAQPGVRDQQQAWQAVPGFQTDFFHRTFASSGSVRTPEAEEPASKDNHRATSRKATSRTGKVATLLYYAVPSLGAVTVGLDTGSFTRAMDASILLTVAMYFAVGHLMPQPKLLKLLTVQSHEPGFPIRYDVFGPFFWLRKRSVEEVHAAAAAKLDLKVEDTVMIVRSEGRPVNLDVYLSTHSPVYRLRRMWDLSQVADVIDISPAPDAGHEGKAEPSVRPHEK